ncbi:hypothetical protein EDD85DRAFT_796529 [Armillaria nabsnona]|nr:hypothetical protein EDD85DRAFT_796529 [Armillaria nabsnona]
MIAATYPGTVVPDLSDSQIKDIFLNLDSEFNRVMLHASLHASKRKTQNDRHLVLILLLYLLVTVGLYYEWTIVCSMFIRNDKTFWTAYEFSPGAPITLTGGIDAVLSTFLADATLIWHCWIVWGRSWRVVLVLIICSTLAMISRGIVAFYETFRPENMSPRALYIKNVVNWAILYSLLILATFLWCTILIVYHILRLGGVVAAMRVYHRVIEMLVESASLYSAVIIVLLVFEVRDEIAGAYIEEFAIAIRGIVPTILVSHVAAGHARPDDSWSESIATSSLRFRSHSSSQNDNEMSTTSSHERPDLEEGLKSSAQS